MIFSAGNKSRPKRTNEFVVLRVLNFTQVARHDTRGQGRGLSNLRKGALSNLTNNNSMATTYNHHQPIGLTGKSEKLLSPVISVKNFTR